jgi:hypothetical protein
LSSIIKDLPWAVFYMDDIVIGSENEDEMMERLSIKLTKRASDRSAIITPFGVF